MEITREHSITPRIKVVFTIKRGVMEISFMVVYVIHVVSEIMEVFIVGVLLGYTCLLFRVFCFNVGFLRMFSFGFNVLLFPLSNIVKYSILDRE